MTEEIKVKSGFVLVDIELGRAKVTKALGGDAGYRGRPSTHQIPVTIKGFIVEQYSGDDGVSREFRVEPSSVKLGKPVKVKP